MLAQALPTALFTRPAPSLKDEEDHRDAAGRLSPCEGETMPVTRAYCLLLLPTAST